jgi:hypothetical protein
VCCFKIHLRMYVVCVLIIDLAEMIVYYHTEN